MARPKKEEKESSAIKIDSSVKECPWCLYDNDDPKKGPVHEKDESNIAVATNNMDYQCLTCGKNWTKDQLGQPWTEALERGPAWEREVRARELRGS